MLVDGLHLNVQATGEGESLIWAHGLMSSMAAEDGLGMYQWERFPPTLKLVRYDARGHGQSEAGGDASAYTWFACAQEMLGLADGLGLPRFIAGGASRGCATALQAALLAPQRVRAMILVTPPPLWELRVMHARMFRLANGQGAHPAGAKMPAWLERAEPGAAARSQAPTSATLASLFEGAARSDLPPRAQLASLASIPTLIIGWRGDRAHPGEVASELHTLLPESQLFIAHDYADYLGIPGLIRAFCMGTAP